MGTQWCISCSLSKMGSAASGDVDQLVLVWEILIVIPMRKLEMVLVIYIYIYIFFFFFLRAKKRFDLTEEFRSYRHGGISRSG